MFCDAYRSKISRITLATQLWPMTIKRAAESPESSVEPDPKRPRSTATEKGEEAPAEDSSLGEWLPNSVTSIDDKFRFASSTYHSQIPKNISSNPTERVVLGVDEAGRGPVMGPMVYGIAYALESYLDSLKKNYGFADSKTLKDDKRQELFRIIENPEDPLNANVGWATTTMTAKDISSGMLQNILGKGAYNLNEQAHDTTIQLIKEVLEKGVNLTSVFVDTVGPPVTYQAKLKKIFPNIDVVVTKKADSIYPIVSTASVVAKVTRDINLQYFNRHLKVLQGQRLGSGYPSDPNTSKWLNSNVDKVFGWHFGMVRFLWQTAKDSLEKHKAANVIYEAECVNDSGYQDVSGFFGKEKPKSVIDSRYYGSTEVDI